MPCRWDPGSLYQLPLSLDHAREILSESGRVYMWGRPSGKKGRKISLGPRHGGKSHLEANGSVCCRWRGIRRLRQKALHCQCFCSFGDGGSTDGCGWACLLDFIEVGMYRDSRPWVWLLPPQHEYPVATTPPTRSRHRRAEKGRGQEGVTDRP